MTRIRPILTFLALVALSACSYSGPSTPSVTLSGAHEARAVDGVRADTHAATPIRNLIIVVQEDRSFDNIFAGFPNADAGTSGLLHTGQRVPLEPISLAARACSILGYQSLTFETAFDHGKMDGWDLLDRSDPRCPYTYVNRSQSKPYWDLGQQYEIGDRMFGSTILGDFVEHQYLIRGSTAVKPGEYVIDAGPLGCDAPPGTRSTILVGGKVEVGKGPFPCFTYTTIASRLDQASVSWKYYAAPRSPWNAFEYIKYVREGQDWARNISIPETNIFGDLKNGTLAQVSWVTPSILNSDHPGSGSASGPAWVKSVVEAVQASKYWDHAAIVVLWDDAGSGQFYDNAPPPQLDYLGLGFRVPMIAISPFSRPGVSHVSYEVGGSTLKFIEENWKLRSLGTTDVRANSIGHAFVFPPRVKGGQ